MPMKPKRNPRRHGPRTDPERKRQRAGRPERRTPRARPHATAGSALRDEVAGVRLSTPARVYFADLAVTKSEIALYYESVAERALPGLLGRPLSLLRCPEGISKHCFYQRHANESVPERVGRVVVQTGEAPYAMVTDLPSLVALVQIGVIELHVWGARADQLERPDLLVLDLDPDPSVGWPRLSDAARRLGALLRELGLVPFLRTTGGKGLHVVVPLVQGPSWSEVKAFTHAVARRFARESPDRFTARISKAKREGKILIDYLRNQRGATAIACYSLRARPGAPVALPIAWEELDGARALPTWSVRDVHQRMAEPDPWAAFETSRRALTSDARWRVGEL